MNKFKVGDRVRGTGADIKGCEGTITEIRDKTVYMLITKLGELAWHDGRHDEFQLGRVFHRRGCDWGHCLELIIPVATTWKEKLQ